MAPSITASSTHYALVIDAGSSGSRLQIYSWRDPDLERAEIIQEVNAATLGTEETRKGRWWWDAGMEKLKLKGKGKGKQKEVLERKALRRLVRIGKGVEGDEWVKRVEPGISTVSPEDIPTYLSPLLSHALRHIPPSQHSSTPIYILATAGMRLLPPEESSAILQASCNLIRNDYPFRVDGPSSAGPCGDSIRVISGEEEGMWGWVAVNYLMDGVTPVDVNHHSPTFGFLDMGGASTQLAFSPSPSELLKSGYPKDQLGTVSLRLLSGEVVEWPVFVASWLGFGTNRARERYAESLIAEWREQGLEITGTSLDAPIFDPCLPANLEIPSDDPTDHPGFRGSGSFSTCLTKLTPLLEHSTPCPTEHCLFAGLPTPHIDFEREDQRGFIGISEYWYTSEQVLGLGGVWDWGEWEKGMNEFCAKDWNEIEDEVEREKGWRGSSVSVIGPTRLQMQCFKGAWISNVLHEGIGIPRLVDAGGNSTLTNGELGDTNAEAERRAREKGLIGQKKSHFQSMDEVGETAISWTLGKMVIEASKAVKPRSYIAEDAWTARIGRLPLGGWEDRLEKMGIQTLWAYGFVTFFILACLFTYVRRRLYLHQMKKGVYGRRRKPSVSDYSVEDGGVGMSGSGYLSDSALSASGLGKSRFSTPGRIRLWTLRLGNTAKRFLPFGMGHSLHFGRGRHSSLSSRPRPTPGSGFLPRHNSMPLPLMGGGGGANGSASASGTNLFGYTTPSNSQPPSPKGNPGSFFIPANALSSAANGNSVGGGLTVPSTRPGSTTPSETGYSSASTSTSGIGLGMGMGMGVANSPPRIKSQRGKPRNASYTTLASAYNYDRSAASAASSAAGGSGWNDPPLSMLSHNHNQAAGGYDDRSGVGLGVGPAGILTPTAANLSRNSSRVNLNEMSMINGLSRSDLAQRSASRAGTPGFDETP
ncbi:hypothetical protein I317_03204 [Kwoniella heveanensis CBS 569]|nr:hypothetical protein I317_03204 [Kwoniella heveanensis CBS 569]